MAINPDNIFQKAFEMNASDVHVAEGNPIIFRIDGKLVPASTGKASEADVTSIVRTVIGDTMFDRFLAERELDVSYSVNDNLRLRVNCHFERGFPGLVARLIPTDVPTLKDVELEEFGNTFCELREGLILFTGPTGAGKSTSMAAMLDKIITEKTVHVITLEDPVEFMFDRSGSGLVRQRQFGEDFTSFGEALRRVLRQDPDVVMVGEMRDLETIRTTLTLAETGHLVFATLHTPNAAQTIGRIIDVFPPHQQNQIRAQLSLSLKVIVAQRLVEKTDGKLAPLREILVNTKAVANVIRENRVHELASVMQMGAQDGMVSFDKDAKRLLEAGIINEESYRHALGIIELMEE